MNKTIKTILIAAGVLVVAVALVMTGFFASRRLNPAWRNANNFQGSSQNNQPNNRGMFGNSGGNGSFFKRGMMGRLWNRSKNFGFGMGGGMMGGIGNGSTNQYFGMGRGMMGWNSANAANNAEPLSLDSAKTAVDTYLKELGNNDLELKEVMVFEQNAYAVVTEKSTGTGAMELLVDPSTRTVFPEYGPERMWNTKYGMMGNGQSAGSCGCGVQPNAGASSIQTPLTLDEAAATAGKYLAANVTDAVLNADGQPFYGYYTFDYQVGGKIAGMLSVNSTSGQVWPHTWHGQFIEEWESSEG